MITIILEKPERSVDIIGYGKDSYKDKSGKEVWKIYGVVKFGGRSHIIEGENVTKVYGDDATITIVRSEDKEDIDICKTCLDTSVANGEKVFPVSSFKEYLARIKEKNGVDVSAN